MVNNPCTAKKTLVSLDAVTQRRQHAFLSLRGFNSRPVGPLSLCVLFSPCGHYRRLLSALLRCDSLPSTFLPPVPRRCFAFSASRGFCRCGTMKVLTPAPFTYDAGLPTYFATPSCRSVSNHVDCPVIAYHHASVTRGFRTSPCMSRLVAVPRRIEFVILRTDCSPPVALHLASRRRSYLRLRSLWLPPTRTFTVLMWRPHGRTHTRARGYPG